MEGEGCSNNNLIWPDTQDIKILFTATHISNGAIPRKCQPKDIFSNCVVFSQKGDTHQGMLLKIIKTYRLPVLIS